MQLENKIVIVTGASSRLGEATCKALALRGAHVVLLGGEHSDLVRVAQEIRIRAGSVSVYPVAVTDLAAVARVASLVDAELGCAEVFVDCAGVEHELDHGASKRTASCSMRAFLPHMIARGAGHLVHVLSAPSAPLHAALGVSPLELTNAGIHTSVVYTGELCAASRCDALVATIVRAVEGGSREPAWSARLSSSLSFQRMFSSLHAFSRPAPHATGR